MKLAVGVVRAWIEDVIECGLPTKPENIVAIEMTIRVAWKDASESDGVHIFKRGHLFPPLSASRWDEDEFSVYIPNESESE